MTRMFNKLDLFENSNRSTKLLPLMSFRHRQFLKNLKKDPQNPGLQKLMRIQNANFEILTPGNRSWDQIIIL